MAVYANVCATASWHCASCLYSRLPLIWELDRIPPLMPLKMAFMLRKVWS
jgi:hypothetical protein